MIAKSYYTYILTNKYNRVLYTGVTNNLKRRVREHRSKHKGAFTFRYNDPLIAIKREKQIKNLVRRKKTFTRCYRFAPAFSRITSNHQVTRSVPHPSPSFFWRILSELFSSP